MLWKLRKQRRQEEIIQQELKEEEEKEKKKKNPKTKAAGEGAASSFSTSSSFSISRLLPPFSWISSKIMPKTKRSTATRADPDANPKSKNSASSPLPPSALPRRSPGFPSSHESFRRAAVGNLDQYSARFPPSVIAGVGVDVPHRRSLGDDDARIPTRLDQCWRDDRRRHHHSVGDLQLPELRHLIQFSGPLGAAESDGDSGASSEYGAPSPPRRPLRGPRRTNAAARPSDGDRTETAPRKSFSGKTRGHRARPKVKISSPRPSASATARRKRAPKVVEEKEKMRELERFAVVKRSRDPQRDFRESMVEMIWERGIGRPEELESLLACYLSLNADEHHDVIVKVFRQVWFELNPELFSQYCYCYCY